ncbi:MAG: zinc ribbon domain-containing protein [Methylohalobius sp. ZOD2]
MSSQWQKPLQSLVAMIATWILGMLVAQIPVFAHPLVANLSLAEAVLYLTQFALLILFFILGRQIGAALPENGKTCSFLRAILTPLVVLIILGLGQETLLNLTSPYLSVTGERLLIVAFWLAILVSAGWLIWLCYTHASKLVAGIIALVDKLRHWRRQIRTCPACGAHLKEDFPYCPYCGAPLQTGHSELPPGTTREP